MPDDFSDIHDALGIKSLEDVGPNPAAKFLARGAGEISGISDLVRAVQSGRPENMLYAGGMLGIGALMPGFKAGKAASAAGVTMSKLFPEATWLGPSGLLHPQEYVDKLGGAAKFAENFPESFKKLKPFLSQTNDDLSDYAINKALEKNPGASIADISGVGPHSTWQQKAQAATNYARANALTSKDFPREVPFGIPPKARAEDYNVAAVHGTPDRWGWEGPKDQLKLPEDQLGVHFGSPAAASRFSIPSDVPNYLSESATYKAAEPRTYPVVLRAQSPLETRDMGSWGLDEMKEALSEINVGEHISHIGGKRQLSNWAEGQFPQNELNKLHNIGDVRDYLTAKGYDSIKYVNTVEDPGHTSHILFQDSPVAPGYVMGARSPFAAFDPGKSHWASLTAGGAGILAYPLSKSGGDEK